MTSECRCYAPAIELGAEHDEGCPLARPKLTAERARELLAEGRKIRLELEKRIRD